MTVVEFHNEAGKNSIDFKIQIKFQKIFFDIFQVCVIDGEQKWGTFLCIEMNEIYNVNDNFFSPISIL